MLSGGRHQHALAAALLVRAASSAATLASSPPSDKKPSEVFDTFRSSVVARTVGNSALRKYVEKSTVHEIQEIEAAVAGCKSAGLKLDAKTNEVLLLKLVEAGKVKSALELHAEMKRDRVVPTSEAYNILMRLCLERDMSSSVQSLYEDMLKRGRSPNSESYELVIAAMATENPPQWERAVQVFDKITRERNSKVSTRTYNALMQVYLNMSPFDWRIVYNCYYELRQLHPKVPLSWESYALVKQAFQKGDVGRTRRFLTYVDAWFVLTHHKSVEFWVGVIVFVASMMGLKGLLGYLVAEWGTRQRKSTKSDVDAFI